MEHTFAEIRYIEICGIYENGNEVTRRYSFPESTTYSPIMAVGYVHGSADRNQVYLNFEYEFASASMTEE